MVATISNAADRPIGHPAGTVPNVSGALRDWYQPLTFTLVQKNTQAFQALEIGQSVSFRGVIQPFTDRQLYLKPEGQRAWTWIRLFAQPVLKLNVDDVVRLNGYGILTRVMSRKDFEVYGYIEYHLIEDWTGSGP